MTYPQHLIQQQINKSTCIAQINSLKDELNRVGKKNKPVTSFVFNLLNDERLKLARELNRIPLENREENEVLQLQQQLKELSDVLQAKLVQTSLF